MRRHLVRARAHRPVHTAARTGATVLITATVLVASGCGSSSSSSDTSSQRAAAATTQQVALTPTALDDVVAQKVSSNVGDTLVITVACTRGDEWMSRREGDPVTRITPGSPLRVACVDGQVTASFDSKAGGTQKITFTGKIRGGGLKGAAVLLTVAGPATAGTADDEVPAGQ